MQNTLRYLKPSILFLEIILIFFPILGYCQESTVDISVSAQVAAPPGPQLDQIHYHWRADDGTEVTANSATGGLEDTVLTNLNKNTRIRLRIEISNEGASTSDPISYRLEYGLQETTCYAITSWIDVSEAGGDWDMSDSEYIRDGEPTTNISVSTGGVTDENDTFVAGEVRESQSITSPITLTETQFTEIEYSIKALDSAEAGETYCFRLTNNGTTTNFTYTRYPQVSIYPALPPPPAVGVPLPPAEVIFKGWAYPDAFLTILKNGGVAATFKAKPSGLFEKKLTGLREGTYTFGIWAEDTEGRKSVTQSFTVTLIRRTVTTVSRIFIPPTIELSSAAVGKGETLNIFGQVFPESQVDIFISPGEIVKETIASSEGKWSFKLDTISLAEGEYKVRAKAFLGEGEQSPFSQTLSFLVLFRCRGADLNFDGKVNIIDFSILLYFWHSTSPENICADINQDGIVDLVDFSIMMYQWTS